MYMYDVDMYEHNDVQYYMYTRMNVYVQCVHV